MRFTVILGLLTAILGAIEEDMRDKKLTVKEAYELAGKGIDELGIGDVVIIDLTKKSSNANK